MLDLKHEVGKVVQKSDIDSPWLRCTVRLRAPVYYDEPIVIETEKNTRGITQAILTNDEGLIKMSCKLQAVEILESVPSCDSNVITTLAQDYQQFVTLFNAGQNDVPSWLFFDAVLFREILGNLGLINLLSTFLPGVEGQRLIDIFQRYAVIQTHHELWFENKLFNIYDETMSDWSIRCEYAAPVVVGDLSKGATVFCIVNLMHQAQPMMRTAITLKIASLK